MIKEEVIKDKVVFYCDNWKCVTEGYLMMTYDQAITHTERHIRENEPRPIN